jgi:hypothetical protein
MNEITAWLKQRNLTAHSLVIAGAAAASMWATNAEFRAAIENLLHEAPHWVQSLAALAPFVTAIYASFVKLGGEAGQKP